MLLMMSEVEDQYTCTSKCYVVSWEPQWVAVNVISVQYNKEYGSEKKTTSNIKVAKKIEWMIANYK